MFHTINAQFMHVAVVSNYVSREFPFLLYQDVEHQSQHREAEEDHCDNKDL